MSLRNFGPRNTSSEIQSVDSSEIEEYGEQQGASSIFSGMSRVSIPQAGKKGSAYSKRLETFLKDAKRDPIRDNEWDTVPEKSRSRLKQIVEDVITVSERQEDGTYKTWEYLQFRVVPLMSYTEWTKRADDPSKSTKRGGLQLWEFNSDPKHPKYKEQIMGSDAKVLCRSDNGVVPRPEYVGKTQFRNTVNAPFHPSFEKFIPIGEDGYGNRLDPEKLCKTCPFRSWANGKAPCGEKFVYVGWAPAQVDRFGEVMSQRLVLIDGPYSLQAALAGAKKGTKWGTQKKDLPKWDDLCKPTRKDSKIVPAADFDETRYAQIVGFASSDVKFDHMRGLNFVEVAQGTITDANVFQEYVEGLVQSGELSAVTHVHVVEQEYAWAPEGVNGPIRPMEMVSVSNMHDNPQRIPMISAKEDDTTPIFEPLLPRERSDFILAYTQAMILHRLWETQMKEQVEAVRRKLYPEQYTDVAMEDLPSLISGDAFDTQAADDLDE